MSKVSLTLRDLGIGLVGIAVPLAFVPSAEDAYLLPQLLALALALACLSASGLLAKRELKIGLFELLAAAYYAWRLISHSKNNFGPGLGGRLGRETLYVGLFFWASQNLQDPIASLKVKRAVITGMIFASAYGVLQAYGWDPFAAGRQEMGFAARAHATFGNPDFFGGALILVLPFALAKYLLTGQRPALLALFVLALLLTQTRAAWLGFAAGSALFIWGARAELKPKALAGLLAGLLALFTLLSVPNPLNPRQINLSKRVTATASQDLGGRVMMSKVGMQIALKHPFLGVGSGEAYTQAYLRSQGELLYRLANSLEPYRYTHDIHNDWLQLAGEAGLPGFLLFLALWAGLGWRLLKLGQIEPLVLACILLSFGVNAFLHFPLAVIPSGALIWLTLGWAAAVTRAREKSAAPTAPYLALLAAAFSLALWNWRALEASVLLNRGMNFSLSGQTSQAYSPLLRGATLAPSDPRAWMRLGLNEDGMGHDKEAMGYFSKAVAAQPALPEALGNLGLSEAKLGKLEEGKQHCLQALEINPRSVEILGNLGKIEYLRGDVAAAEVAYGRGLAQDPNWVQGHFNLAAIYLNTKRPKLARPHLQAVLSLDPGNAQAAQLLKGLK